MDLEPDNLKPRRRYTLTDKAREARRLSLAKARAKAKLALRGHKRGDQEDDVAYQSRLARQIKPWCANLRQAVAARQADRSATYATHFIHGLTAPDLDRSAAAAGEDREQLREHIESCQRTIGGLAGLKGSGFGVRGSNPLQPNLKSQIPNPESRKPNPENRTPMRTANPKPRTRGPESRAPSPELRNSSWP